MTPPATLAENAPGAAVSTPIRPRRARRRAWLATAAGVLVAALAYEAALRQLTTTASDSPASAAADQPREPVHTRRVYYEGIATANFSPGHSRLTGGAWIPGAPVGVIVGDSHVEAVQVEDGETMGAVVERGLRARGIAVNVRQFGRAGGSAPRYVQEAPEILARWNPAWVVVVLGDNDLDTNPLTENPRFDVRPDTSFTLVAGPPRPEPRGFAALKRRLYADVVGSTALGYMTLLRAERVMGGPAPVQPPLRPTDPGYPVRRLSPIVTVRALRRAYGERLHVVYIPAAGITPRTDQRLFEAALLEACRAEGVGCTSLFSAFVQARDRDRRMTRGFANTAPAVAHLNAHGHRLTGEAIVRAVGR